MSFTDDVQTDQQHYNDQADHVVGLLVLCEGHLIDY